MLKIALGGGLVAGWLEDGYMMVGGWLEDGRSIIAVRLQNGAG
jgi:hypothetical protein